MTQKKLSDYKDFVKQLSLNEDGRIFLNSDPDHAVVVAEQIFRQSKEEVRIFAKNLCRTIGNAPEYISAISDFIERGGKVRILLNGYEEECAKVSNLYKRLAYYKSLGKDIIVKTTNAIPFRSDDEEQNEIHFTVGDKKAYRIETNTEQRSAECSMNNVDIATNTAEFFDELFNNPKATEVNILKLFGYDELILVR